MLFVNLCRLIAFEEDPGGQTLSTSLIKRVVEILVHQVPQPLESLIPLIRMQVIKYCIHLRSETLGGILVLFHPGLCALESLE